MFAACCLTVFACIAFAADNGRSAGRSHSGEWIILDSHTHTTFSDGRHDVEDVVASAAEQGCDALAITDHADVGLSAATPAYFAAVNDARVKFPGMLIMAGLEWNIPPYETREHVTVLLEPGLEETVLPRLKVLFKGWGRADPALRWLAAALSSPDDAVLFYNHPSRRDVDAGENLADLRAWREVNDLVTGFEGGPGHQKGKPIAAYDTRFSTVDRWDPVVAELGGTWDVLLDSGMDVWAALAVSDYHGFADDYRPCEFARTHVYVRTVTTEALLEALRAGSFWADHGRILDELDVTVSAAAIPGKIVPGERVAVSRYDGATVGVRLKRGSGASEAPLVVEIIGNCAGGDPELIAVDRLQPGETTTEHRIEQLEAGSDRKSCYVRAQVRRPFDGAPDLMAVTNAVRLVLEAEPATVASRRDTRDLESRGAGTWVFGIGTVGAAAVIVTILVTGAAWVRVRLFGDTQRRRSSAPGRRAVGSKTADARRSRRKSGESRMVSHHSAISSTSLSVDEKARSVDLMKDGTRRLRLSYDRVQTFEVRINGMAITRISRHTSIGDDDGFDELLQMILGLQSAQIHQDDSRRIDLVTTYDGGATAEHVLNFYYRVGNRRRSAQSFEDSAQAVVEWLRYLNGEVFASREQSAPAGPVRDGSEDAAAHGQPHSIARELERLADLRACGELSDEEYDKAKSRLLD